MFQKKKKPNFPLRPPYSIREELEALNPFVRRDKIGAMQSYTMEDIQAAERRLDFELPAPIRDLYLLMTKQLVPYSFAQEMEGKTGLLFCSRNGNGKDKVLTRRREMREQGSFRPARNDM